MIEIIEGNRHEYWTHDMWKRYNNEPFCNRWKPEFVLYEWYHMPDKSEL